MKIKPANLKAWVIKEVGGDPKSILSQWRQLFYSSKIIVILRNPKMVTRSILITRRNKQKLNLSFYQIFQEVLNPIRNLIEVAEMTAYSGIYVISYEDLVDDPEKTMKSVCTYLNTTYNESYLKTTIFGREVVTRTASENKTKTFNTKKDWKSGLKFKEVLLVRLFTFFIAIGVRFIRPKPNMLSAFAIKNAGMKKVKSINYTKIINYIKTVQNKSNGN